MESQAADAICNSEVHYGASDSASRTRFLMRLTDVERQSTQEDANSEADSDGDLLVTRKKNTFNLAITIFHNTVSSVSLAGLQVWKGCLIMCDYFLAHPHSVKGHVVLELGSGTGMAAILAAHITSAVFATDNSALVLAQCKQNVDNNIPSCSSVGEVHVGLLDWKSGFTPDLDKEKSLKEFIYSPQQLKLLKSSGVIIACDTIYDLEGVNCFLSCIEWLVREYLHAECVELYLSMERRINFSLHTLSAGCQPYEALFRGIEILREKLSASNIRVSWKHIYLESRQMVEYERSEDLQLWKIQFENRNFA